MANELSKGAFGRKLVEYLSNYAGSGKIPVDAEVLDDSANIGDQWCYRITFDDESVSDWLITFESKSSLNIVSAECFNEVI